MRPSDIFPRLSNFDFPLLLLRSLLLFVSFLITTCDEELDCPSGGMRVNIGSSLDESG